MSSSDDWPEDWEFVDDLLVFSHREACVEWFGEDYRSDDEEEERDE